MARVDYDKQSAVYDRGRDLPPEGIAVWMAAAKRHAKHADRILDLGSGTGRFSAALAEAFQAHVVAVEPSKGMRERAATKPHARVDIVAGASEHLPLADASCDVAWLSNVIHHFDDVHLATTELRRVTKPNGTVLIRGAFGNKPVPSLYRFFPGTRDLVDSFPSMPDVIAAFQAGGFTSFYNEQIEQLLAYKLADMVERIRMRADTTLELLPDDEFQDGLKALEEAARTEDGPLIDRLDLLVIR